MQRRTKQKEVERTNNKQRREREERRGYEMG